MRYEIGYVNRGKMLICTRWCCYRCFFDGVVDDDDDDDGVVDDERVGMKHGGSMVERLPVAIVKGMGA